MGKKDRHSRHGKPDASLDQAAVLKLFKSSGRPLTLRNVLAGLKAAKVHKAKLQHILDQLETEGRIIRLSHGAWGLAESMKLLTGRLEIQRSGVGFVICDDKRRADIFINPRDFGGAWHGDRVAVAITSQRGRRAEGRIARVVERAAGDLPCRVERRIRQGMYLCRPTDPRYHHALIYEPDEGGDVPAEGDVLALRAGERLDHDLFAATLVSALGPENDVSVQEKLVKMSHSIPGPFPARCLDQAAGLPAEPGEEDFAGRKDMRDSLFVTIDGESARDFDDAILVEPDGGGFTLYVAIADVGHYVPLNSPLDLEALSRGNSYYFPQSVEPMFPEALSNGLCSLNPGVPRLAMVVETAFTGHGVPGESRFYPAVIRSRRRLTYNQVNEAVLLGDEPGREAIADVMPMLLSAEKLARAIRERRMERGSLDFDLPEPEIVFDSSGAAVDIKARERNFAHQIIEEFMIAANEAVARFLTERGAPVAYRIHPEPDPDKLETLFQVIRRTELGLTLKLEPTALGLQKLLAHASGTDMEFVTSRLLLRSMMQAKYSTVNEGHYGLASSCYCHFTSPIRRYADLMVHRALKAELDGSPPPLPARRMQPQCENVSQRERVAMEAEREMYKRVAVLFLRERVGEEFDGVVSSLSDFGFWVELTEVMAEGLVRLSSLTDDYYALFPERQELLGHGTGRRIRLGQPVRVTLYDVNLARLEIDLRLAGGPESLARGRGVKAPRKAGKGAGGASPHKPGKGRPSGRIGGRGAAGKKR